MSIRHTSTYELPPISIGTRQKLTFHEYVPAGQTRFDYAAGVEHTLDEFRQDRIYIQGSLHCDELPGMLVCNHLIKLVDQAARENRILKPITIAPYANPIGLQQILLGSHLGRFSLSTGINFNRDWVDVTDEVLTAVKPLIIPHDQVTNAALIRRELFQASSKLAPNHPEKVMKREIFRRACISQVVLDLHCDSDAIMHAYTHDRLWPQFADLHALLQCKVTLLASDSGGKPFDEACSVPWAKLQDALGSEHIPFGGASMTVELRGESDVYDNLAAQDAHAIFGFLQLRGYVSASTTASITEEALTTAITEGWPLTGVDMIEATAPGVLAWRVHAGDIVEAGQLLGEIVNMEDIDQPRLPIIARTGGLVYGMARHKLAVPGDIVVKVAGKEQLAWRKGNLLTAR